MISTVVGNFPKVGDTYELQKLRRGIEAHQQGKISAQELKDIEDEFTRLAVEEQINAGIQLITDGQIRWIDPVTWPSSKLKGIKITGLLRFFDNNVYYRQPVVESAVSWEKPLVTEDFAFAQKTAGTRAEVKAVLPGPFTLAKLSKNNHYADFSHLVLDLAKALAMEVQSLEKAGAKFIQFDEPSLLFHGEELPLAAQAFEIIRKASPAATLALYTYFSGITKVFPGIQNLQVDVLGLDLVSSPENANLLKQNRFTKKLALGVVDARNTKLENPADLEKLIRSFDKNADQIEFVNPSCGLEFLPRETAVKKLAQVGNLAGKIKQAV